MLINWIGQKDIQKLDETTNKSCENETEVIKSNTVYEIIRIIQDKTIENPQININELYHCFANSYPISENDINYLIEFFENKKNQKLAQKVFSWLEIKSWNSNRKFINDFLINSEWKNDIDNFIRYVTQKLKNYTYKINFEFDTIAVVEKKVEPNYRFFVYKKEGKRWIITTNWNNITISDNIYSSITYVKNWVFLWRKKEKWTEKDKSSGDILIFNNWNIENKWTIDDIKEITSVDEKWNITFKSKSNKTWIKKSEKSVEIIDGEEKINIKLLDKLPPEYDSVEMKYWLIFANKILNEKQKTIEIFWQKYKKILTKDIISSEFIEWVENKKIIKFKTVNWDCYYEINNNWEIKSVDYLQNVKTFLKPKKISDIYKSLDSLKPVFIKYNWDRRYLVFKNEKNEILTHKFEEIITDISPTDIGLDKKLFLTYIINFKTYIFDIINKELFKSNKSYRFKKGRRFDSLLDDLEPINLVLFEKIS